MNVENRTIFEGDNLHILREFDSETIDLMYLDPPFNYINFTLGETNERNL